MNKYTRMNWENTPSTATPLTADNLNHMDEGIEQVTDGAIVLEAEITTARGEYANLGERLDTSDTAIAKKADRTNTLAGYGIINAYTKTEIINLLANKEDNSNKVSSKSSVTNESDNYPSIKYLNDNYYDFTELYASDEVDILLNAKADSKPLDERLTRMDISVNSKYDSANIESGSSTLTPYSSQTGKSKSAACIYKKVGDTVFANVSIVMNAGSLGANSTLHFIDLPFRHNSELPVYFIGINNKGTSFKGIVPKGSTWFQIMSSNAQAYTFTDGEQLNFTLMYKI